MRETSCEVLKRPLESDLPERVEVRVRRERGRVWTPEDKLRIVQAAFAPGAVAKRVAERHAISTGLLFTWLRQFMAAGSAGFVPVRLISAATNTSVSASAPSSPPGSIEIDMPNGVRVRAGHGADLKVLRAVLATLDGR